MVTVTVFSGGSAIRYAILTFHTIIAEKTANGRNIEIARANNALQAITQFLDRESNEKLLSVIVECVRLLCDKSQTQRVSSYVYSSLFFLILEYSDEIWYSVFEPIVLKYMSKTFSIASTLLIVHSEESVTF